MLPQLCFLCLAFPALTSPIVGSWEATTKSTIGLRVKRVPTLGQIPIMGDILGALTNSRNDAEPTIGSRGKRTPILGTIPGIEDIPILGDILGSLTGLKNEAKTRINSRGKRAPIPGNIPIPVPFRPIHRGSRIKRTPTLTNIPILGDIIGSLTNPKNEAETITKAIEKRTPLIGSNMASTPAPCVDCEEEMEVEESCC